MTRFSAGEAGAFPWRGRRTLAAVACCLGGLSCGPFAWEEKELAPAEPLPTAAPRPQPVTPPPRVVVEGRRAPELEELRHLECTLATRFIQSLPPERLRSSLVVSPHAITRAIAALAATTTGATRAELVNLLGSEERLDHVLWWLELGEHRWRDRWELEDREARERRQHERSLKGLPPNQRKPPFVRRNPLSVAAELFLFGDATYDEVLDKFPRSPAHFGSAFDRQGAANSWWQNAPQYAEQAVSHVAGGHVLASTLWFVRPFPMWKENPSDRRYTYIDKSNEHLQRAGFCYSEFFGPLIDDTRVYGVARFDYVAVTPVLAGPLETLQSACEIFRVGDEYTPGELAALDPSSRLAPSCASMTGSGAKGYDAFSIRRPPSGRSCPERVRGSRPCYTPCPWKRVATASTHPPSPPPV